MPRTATRTASVFTRIDPETKEQAEIILDQLGIPLSNAICMFLRQIVLQKGIPFDMRLPQRGPVELNALSTEQFDAELNQGFDDMLNARVLPADEVEAEVRGLFRS